MTSEPLGEERGSPSLLPLSGDQKAAIRATRQGLPVTQLQDLVDTGRLSLTEIDRIILPRKTLSHRRKIGVLTPNQSDRLLRVAGIVIAAERTFGSRGKAARWLRRPTTALDGETPISLLDTTAGSRVVEDLLSRIDYGLAT
jgi:putative toxin-antitoxin system antitoxin component (TIGR02293 family)